MSYVTLAYLSDIFCPFLLVLVCHNFVKCLKSLLCNGNISAISLPGACYYIQYKSRFYAILFM